MKPRCSPSPTRKLISGLQDLSFLFFICGFAVVSSPLWGPVAYRRWKEAGGKS